MADKLIVSTPVDMEGQELCDSVLNLPTVKAFPEEPIVGRPGMVYYDPNDTNIKFFDGEEWRPLGAKWGDITGNISDQTDLWQQLSIREPLPTKIPNKFLHTDATGKLEWIIGGGGSHVTYTPTLLSGRECGKLYIDGEPNPIYCSDTSMLLSLDGSRTMLGNLNMGNHRVTNMMDPSQAGDAANKYYVDNRVRASATGTSTNVAKYITVGENEYKLQEAIGTTVVTNITGTMVAVCPSRSGYINVCGYMVAIYSDPDTGKIIINGKEAEEGRPVYVGPYPVSASYANNTFTVACPKGSTFLQDQAGEASTGTTIVTLNDGWMKEEGHEYPLNFPNALNYFDELILCITQNDAPNRLYDRILFRPSRYIDKFYYERYEYDDDDHYIEFNFRSNGPTGSYDIAKLTHTVRLECMGIYGKKYGKINNVAQQTPNTANAASILRSLKR